MKNYKVAIVGAAGYTGGELLRLLLLHPAVSFINPVSRSQSGLRTDQIHKDLIGESNHVFTNTVSGNEDVIFLCMGHGESVKWLNENQIANETIVIDLSQDLRYNEEHPGFVYGLPELHSDEISKSTKIANPGCFATAIQLMLLPLAKNGLLKESINVSAVTGSTGAGQSLSATSHFTWRTANHSAYKTMNHQHEYEIGKTILALQPNWKGQLNFLPQRGAFARGIHATAWMNTSLDTSTAQELYSNFYSTAPFTHIIESSPDLKSVLNTNKCFIHVEVINNQLVVTAVIDNLLKGASGQAVQNMNIALGLEQKTGLLLKPIAY